MNKVTTITLSDLEDCDVKRLGLFELDIIPIPQTKPFTYTIDFGATQITQEYHLSLWDIPPSKPLTPEHEIEEKTKEWYDLREYTLFWGAIEHREQQKHLMFEYLEKVKTYILERCVQDIDQDRIKDKDDWDLIVSAALVPQITLEELNKTATNSFEAKFNNKPILEVFLNRELNEEEPKFHAYYAVVKTWEIQTMNQLGLTEEDWEELLLKERARKIVAYKIDSWMESLAAREYGKQKKVSPTNN